MQCAYKNNVFGANINKNRTFFSTKISAARVFTLNGANDIAYMFRNIAKTRPTHLTPTNIYRRNE